MFLFDDLMTLQFFIFIGPKSDHCLVLSLRHSLSAFVDFCSLLDLSKSLDGYVKIDKWISPGCYMDLSKLINGFVKIVTWICCVFLQRGALKKKLRFCPNQDKQE